MTNGGRTKQLVDRIYVDGGTPARFGQVGGMVVQLNSANPPRPEVRERAGTFFFPNGEPITEADQVAHLPADAKARALGFLARTRPSPRASAGDAAGASVAAPPRPRGRPPSQRSGAAQRRRAKERAQAPISPMAQATTVRAMTEAKPREVIVFNPADALGAEAELTRA
jgi:hypothetical protein